ncbi:glutamate-1-semialdehyde aminotransferase [Paenibacillus sp. JCM 10914]|nr:glutamate-1-semialdehyde aminotransferase [Paenibacillus sp. JCM 10914]
MRAFKSVGLTPIYMERGEGSRVFDIDGNTFIDYVGSWGPLIMGHAHPEVVEALQETVVKGTSFGANAARDGNGQTGVRTCTVDRGCKNG